jgi:D-amino-acid dehydrogenase
MPVIDDSKLFGLVPVGDRMRISGSAEITGYDATPAQSRADAIIANTTFTFPSLAAHYRPDAAKVWAGLRPVTPAGTPLIGATAIKGVWINAGHGHLGWTLACGSGRALAAMVDGGNAGLGAATLQALTSQRALQ